jgi:hypothetical protein
VREWETVWPTTGWAKILAIELRQQDFDIVALPWFDGLMHDNQIGNITQ